VGDATFQLVGVPVQIAKCTLLSHRSKGLAVGEGCTDIDCSVIEDLVVIASTLHHSDGLVQPLNEPVTGHFGSEPGVQFRLASAVILILAVDRGLVLLRHPFNEDAVLHEYSTHLRSMLRTPEVRIPKGSDDLTPGSRYETGMNLLALWVVQA